MLLAFSVSVSVFRDCPLALKQVPYYSVLDLLGARHIFFSCKIAVKNDGCCEVPRISRQIKKIQRKNSLARDLISIFSESRTHLPRLQSFGIAATTSADLFLNIFKFSRPLKSQM